MLGCFAAKEGLSDTPSGSAAAFLVRAGFVPKQEPYLLAMCTALRSSILRGIQV